MNTTESQAPPVVDERGDDFVKVSLTHENPAEMRRDKRTQQPCLPSKTLSNALVGENYFLAPDDRPRWNPDEKIPPPQLEKPEFGVFRLKLLENAPKPKGTKQRMSQALDGEGSIQRMLQARDGVAPPPKAGKTTLLLPESVLTERNNVLRQRAEKYFQALLRAERKRKEMLVTRDYDEKIKKAEKLASRATRRVIDRELELKAKDREERLARGEEVTESEASEPGEIADEGEEVSSELEEQSTTDDDGEEIVLMPYDGNILIELEFAVNRADNEASDASDDPDDDKWGSIAGPEGGKDGKDGAAGAGVEDDADDESSHHESDEGGDLGDLQEELAALQEELGGVGGEEEEENDDQAGLPAGLERQEGGPSIYNIDDPRLKLGIAGTIFFVPEAERYAICPSLPPPPPPSLLGRRRLRLKPRLPLDISSGRYRDEHPNLWSLDQNSFDPPRPEDRRRFEEIMITHDFYASASKSMTQLPKMRRGSVKEIRRQRIAFSRMLENHLRRSRLWQRRCRRELTKRQRKKEEENDFGTMLIGGMPTKLADSDEEDEIGQAAKFASSDQQQEEPDGIASMAKKSS